MNNTLLKKLLKRLRLNETSISTFLGLVVVLIIGAIIVNFFRQNKTAPASQPTETETTETEELAPKNETETTYTVQANDTLWQIAEKYYQDGFAWPKIATKNNLSNPSLLTIGQKLIVPKTEEAVLDKAETIQGDIYTVIKGDNLWQIAVRAYGDGYQWVKIAQANNLKNPSLIHPGNELQLPR